MSPLFPEIALFRKPFAFVRHGESTSNLSRTIAGSLDVALTERGRAQAREAADALRDTGVTAIYSSGLRRALDTANEIACALGLRVAVIPDLAERCWGQLEGKPRELRVNGITPPGAETPDQFRARVLGGLAAIEPGGKPLVVAHAGVFRTLCAVLDIPALAQERIDNAQPVCFLPPDATSHRWRFEAIGRAPA